MFEGILTIQQETGNSDFYLSIIFVSFIVLLFAGIGSIFIKEKVKSFLLVALLAGIALIGIMFTNHAFTEDKQTPGYIQSDLISQWVGQNTIKSPHINYQIIVNSERDEENDVQSVLKDKSIVDYQENTDAFKPTKPVNFKVYEIKAETHMLVCDGTISDIKLQFFTEPIDNGNKLTQQQVYTYNVEC